MTIQKSDCFLQAIARKPVERMPIWLMRQAGRYLPEYRKLRAEAGSFLKLCKTPELACEVTLQPLRRFPLDAAILFSDILTIPDAMGLGLQFKEGEGPYFEHPIQTAKAVKDLQVPDPQAQLSYVLDAIKLIQKEINGKVPLIGFCGSPWTLAAYMVEGRAEKSFPKIQKMLEEEPRLLHDLLTILADSVAQHLNAQIRAGVQAVMLFDTWGGLLNTENYQQFSLHYLKLIIKKIQNAPVILFTKNGGDWLELIAESGCQVAGLDTSTSIASAKARIGSKVVLQGNLDPEVLLTTPKNIQQEALRILNEFGPGNGYIFNLGHGVLPNTPWEHVAVLVEAVHGGCDGAFSNSYFGKSLGH